MDITAAFEAVIGGSNPSGSTNKLHFPLVLLKIDEALYSHIEFFCPYSSVGRLARRSFGEGGAVPSGNIRILPVGSLVKNKNIISYVLVIVPL